MEVLQNSSLFQRFWKVAGAVSLRLKVLGIVLGMIVLLGGVVTLQMRAVLTSALQHELDERGDAIGHSTAAQIGELLREDNLQMVDFLLQERQRHYSSEEHSTHVSYILLLDPQGQVISRADDGTDTYFVREYSFSLPDETGMLRMGLSEASIAQTVSDVTLQLIEITLVMAAVGFAAALFLTWILTRPILTLVDATQAVAQGDFTRRVSRWANDEIGDLSDAFNAMTLALAKADRERREQEALRANYLQGIISAQEEERKRIARELHDSTSQSLTSLLVGLRNLEAAHDAETTQQRIAEIRRVVNHTLEEVHTLAWQLRPSVLDDLGLIAALERYITDYQRRYDIQVDFVERGVCERLPRSVETAVYRIVQEALTNTARHSQAAAASVLLEQRGEVLRLIVEDDGRGFDPARAKYAEKSLGLQGIRERTSLFNGKLTIESQAGQGTSLFVEIPLTEAGAN